MSQLVIDFWGRFCDYLAGSPAYERLYRTDFESNHSYEEVAVPLEVKEMP